MFPYTLGKQLETVPVKGLSGLLGVGNYRIDAQVLYLKYLVFLSRNCFGTVGDCFLPDRGFPGLFLFCLCFHDTWILVKQYLSRTPSGRQNFGAARKRNK